MPISVFLSYRRDDTAGYAGRLYDRLKQRFPRISPVVMVANGGNSASFSGDLTPRKVPDATVITIEEPLAHIRRDFEIPSVRLADYETRLSFTPR